jgi:hypothetical protein
VSLATRQGRRKERATSRSLFLESATRQRFSSHDVEYPCSIPIPWLRYLQALLAKLRSLPPWDLAASVGDRITSSARHTQTISDTKISIHHDDVNTRRR